MRADWKTRGCGICAVLGLAALGSGNAQALPVPVNNADFETQAVVDGGFDTNPTPGWFHNNTGGELSGINDPDAPNSGANFAGEDNYAAVLTNLGPADGGFGFYVQDIAASVQPNTRYTLSLQVGIRGDNGITAPAAGNGDNTGDVRTFLGLSGTGGGGPESVLHLTDVGGTLNAGLSSTPNPGLGGLVTWTVVVDTGAVVSNSGNQLLIELYLQGPAGPIYSALFDDVSVDVSPVPEPASLGVLTGAAAVLAPRRRRAKH